MTAPKLSVLTTCYNRERYLEECLNSILNSSFQDFELIVVDDQSTDNSWPIIQSFAQRDSRVISVRNDTNLGDYPNRNKAAALARGTYLKYVDADDVISHHFLDILVHSMDEHPQAGLGLFGGRTWPYPIYLTPEDSISQFYAGHHTAMNRSPLMSIIRNATFKAVGGFSGRQHSGDFELWHYLAAHSGLVLMPSLAWVRTHSEQQSEANRTDPRVNFRYLWLSLQLLREFSGQKLLNISPGLIQQKKKHIARTILYEIKRRGWESAKSLKGETDWSWRQIMKHAFS